MHSLNSGLLTFLLLSRLSYFHVLLIPVSAKVFISLDCGTSKLRPYYDGNRIEWVGDEQYIKTGESRNVLTDSPHPWNTVREFPSRKKNCYSLDVNNNKPDEDITERLLVRATFYYGNYDNKSNPPTFSIQFNGNKWAQIETTMEFMEVEEVVYSLNHGIPVTVCLSQTHREHVPFISTLEVRSLDSDMYSYVDSNYPLIFKERTLFGANTNIRYPDDNYDRFWSPYRTTLTWVDNTAPVVKINISDKIPEALFRTALTSLNSSGKISLWDEVRNLNYNYDTSTSLNFNAYFSEVIRLNSTQKRSFDILAQNTGDSDFYVYDTVTPPYGEALQVHIQNVTTLSAESYDYWQIDFVPTKDSTLPPLISALEGYIIGHKLVQGTNAKDVNSLALLQKSFIPLQDWQGDPCLPSPYTWDWVDCDSDKDSPRVIALYLNDSGLVGTLPDFSAMDALQFIDLHNNSLTQAIPDYLGTFPKLVVLNLADNKFSGAIPSSILNNTNLKLIASGNPNLSITNNTLVDRNSTESRIPSSSNYEKSISLTIHIIIGSAIIQILDKFFVLLM